MEVRVVCVLCVTFNVAIVAPSFRSWACVGNVILNREISYYDVT